MPLGKEAGMNFPKRVPGMTASLGQQLRAKLAVGNPDQG
jgi:hypothetical protein